MTFVDGLRSAHRMDSRDSVAGQLGFVTYVVTNGKFKLTRYQGFQAETMRCPKCQFDHELQTTECLKCGIVFSRYQAALEAAALDAEKTAAASAPAVAPAIAPAIAAPQPVSLGELATEREDAVQEFKYRIFAVPVALLVAWLVARTGLRIVAGMLAMVLHESGHAITAWLTGRWAVPMPWVTMHGEERSWGIVIGLAAVICFVGFLAWRAERWGWVLVAGAALLVQMTFLTLPAEAAIVFGGDGGAMVLGTMLMATFYAPRESKIYKSWGLRWGLLAIGALSFLHVFLMWSGPYEDLPFGEIEGVNLSDPSLLTEMYGWSVPQLVDRYVLLGRICLVALLVLYLGGLVYAYLQIPRRALEREGVLANR